MENVTDSQPIACRAPRTRAATPPWQMVSPKMAPHTNPPVKHTVPLTAPHLAEFTVGNVWAKGAWKSLLETWKELVDDEDNPDTMIMLATIEVETKDLVKRWATIDKDAEAYIQNRGATKTGAAAILEHKYFNLYMDMTLANLEKVSRADACPHDEPVFGSDKEYKVEKKDPQIHTAEDENEDRIFENEIKRDTDFGAVNNNLVLPGLRLQWRDSDQEKQLGQDCQRQGISQGPGQDHANELAARPRAHQASLQNKLQMPMSKYKIIQPASISSANREVTMRGANTAALLVGLRGWSNRGGPGWQTHRKMQARSLELAWIFAERCIVDSVCTKN
ncbi:hypothetical protein BDK51DRAFT_29849 [Blyttiomyces helicus]|uniref:Uncharacterized protein n=1 Tax=Blyttiomyces helicus TaxID=388810 RepID=A0A4P9WQJ2_9FUNG|nr:hypothetical protein BDK51DRAFT_29849 [Blyttiomyces helicus]|eukprot:RKO94443.1 hypothetical protein BDK51DRAFT_29849 [Blyttiomyces helicus]